DRRGRRAHPSRRSPAFGCLASFRSFLGKLEPVTSCDPHPAARRIRAAVHRPGRRWDERGTCFALLKVPAMANLIVRTPDGRIRHFNLIKRVTSVGRGPDNDVQVDDPGVPESALHIVFDGSRYSVASHGEAFQVNGKKRDEHVFSPNDIIRLGDSELSFTGATGDGQPRSIENGTAPAGSVDLAPSEPRETVSLRRLTSFSEKLLGSYDLDRLLENLMDEVIELTRADKGFLILMENNELRVKVARNISRENIEDAVERVSDSIVAKVIRSRKPLIISDALDDPEFKASESVVNLKLLSIMCVPLTYRGDLFGLIYVGNDRLVNRFEAKSLDTLTVFAAQASLILQNAMLVNELKLETT